MKRYWQTMMSLVMVIILLFCFTSCGADEGYTSDMVNPGSGGLDESLNENIDLNKTEAPQASESERKIIETIDLDVQTKTFDNLLEDLYEQVNLLGGYVESSDVSGNGFDANYTRYATLTVRIPAEKSDQFSEFISENSVVTRRYVTTEDVTLQYVDIESRLSALETEKESLEALLAKAESVEDIITVQGRLTEVIGDIESYTAQLRTLQNLVSYTTINIDIDEVEKTVVVEKQTTWQRIAKGFTENLKFVGEATVEFFIFAVTSVPFFIPLAVIVLILAIIAFVVYKVILHKKKK